MRARKRGHTETAERSTSTAITAPQYGITASSGVKMHLACQVAACLACRLVH